MIDIYLNTREWGGVDVLVGRFAEYLRRTGVAFKIIDSPKSLLRDQLPWAEIITSEEATKSKSSASAVFFPTISKLRSPLIPWSHFRRDAVAFSWIVHPNDVAYGFMPLAGRAISRFGPHAYTPIRLLQSRHYKLLQRSLSKFVDLQGLAVMDGATARSLEYYYAIDKTPPIIPIPSPVRPTTFPRKMRSPGALTVGYLGRLDSFKWSALKPFILRELAPVAKQKSVSLIAITDGPYAGELRDMSRHLGIALEMKGFLPNDKARAKLAIDCDIAIAMGTSALDVAAEGIPTLIIDPSIRANARPQQKYRFVHEIESYTLGEFRDFPAYQAGGRPFELILSALESGDIGQKDRSYVSTKHDPGDIFPLLHGKILASELRVSELEESVKAINRSFRSQASLFGIRRV